MIYDENEFELSQQKSAQRLARARQRKRRSRRILLGLAVLAVIIVPVFIAAGVASTQAPGAPFLVVTWPNPKIQQTLADSQTVLMRQGQPLMVTVTSAADWNIEWRAGEVKNSGNNFTWSPTPQTSTLKANCTAIVSGWKSYFSFLWPQRELSVNATFAQSSDGANPYARSLVADEKGVWVFPHIQAVGHVAWDERALPPLAMAIPLLPKSELSSELASVSKTPTSRLWQLVSDFDGATDKPSKSGTFASLQASDLENALPMVAAHIVKTVPAASVKFIVRLDKDPQEGIVRLDFDGKRERKSWIRRAGQSAGVPFTGWENGDFQGSAPLALP